MNDIVVFKDEQCVLKCFTIFYKNIQLILMHIKDIMNTFIESVCNNVLIESTTHIVSHMCVLHALEWEQKVCNTQIMH